MIKNKIIIKDILNYIFIHYKSNRSIANIRDIVVKLILVSKEWIQDILPKLHIPWILIETERHLDMALFLLQHHIPLRLNIHKLVFKKYVSKLGSESKSDTFTQLFSGFPRPQERIDRFYQLISPSMHHITFSSENDISLVLDFIPRVSKLDLYNYYPKDTYQLFERIKNKGYTSFNLKKLSWFLNLSFHSNDNTIDRFSNIQWTEHHMFSGLTSLEMSLSFLNLTFLSQLPVLEYLFLERCNFNFDQFCQSINSMPNLTRLKISQEAIPIIRFKDNKTIKYLTLIGGKECKRKDIIDLLNENQNLVELDVDCSFEIDSLSVEYDEKLMVATTTTTTTTTANQIINKTLKSLYIKQPVNIINLFSSDNQLTMIKTHLFNYVGSNPFTFDHFPNLKHLKLHIEPNLGMLPVNPSLISNLESLSLHTTYQSDDHNWSPLWDSLCTLFEFPKLTTLTLDKFPMTMNQLSKLLLKLSQSQVSTLEIINPFLKEINPPSLILYFKHMEQNKQISNLKLKNLGLTNATNTLILLHVLRTLNNLDKFDFQNNNCDFSTHDAKNLFKSLVSNHRIRKLNFQCPDLNEQLPLLPILNYRGIVIKTFFSILNKDVY